MALLCISYFIAISAGMSVVGLLIEHALPASASRRWLWCAVILASFVLPAFVVSMHSSATMAVLGYELFTLPAAQSHVSTTSVSHNLMDCNAIYGHYFDWTWVISLGVLLAWGVANSWRVWRLSRPSEGSRYTIVDGVQVIVTDSIGPATVGVWRSRVVLPRWALALPRRDRQYVVRHEEEHRRARDTWLLAALAALVSLIPWNFALWWQLNRLRLAVELDCDNRVVSALGNPDAYGELLFKVAEASSRGPRLQPAFLGVAGSLEKRLVALITPARRHSLERIAAPILAIGLLVLMLSVPHPQRDGWDPNHSANHAAHANN